MTNPVASNAAAAIPIGSFILTSSMQGIAKSKLGALLAKEQRARILSLGIRRLAAKGTSPALKWNQRGSKGTSTSGAIGTFRARRTASVHHALDHARLPESRSAAQAGTRMRSIIRCLHRVNRRGLRHRTTPAVNVAAARSCLRMSCGWRESARFTDLRWVNVQRTGFGYEATAVRARVFRLDPRDAARALPAIASVER